ncbi:flagellar hook-basal body complex protein FliE [Anaerotignum sp. MB30-C6]|uniref:flagellar hook-basal body complex protein FliE n=1 Tax=Anaerotignum sp. MB30-C6 TaxID=3070814 RepID=UPI0027DD4E71|nr:flagellar hook-basal body complex protein FliE [Anaerotignum sp. MB30-C6]WMI81431.1 flagellar hook-basal body complex protein FliE [Anaerotignum sp. MB30-C6]
MEISSLNRLDPIQLLEQANVSNKGQDKQYDFRNIFSEAVSNVVETDKALAKEQYLFATGQSEDTHSLGFAASKAQISVDLLVTLRNKALESYNELMRINL